MTAPHDADLFDLDAGRGYVVSSAGILSCLSQKEATA